MKILAVTEGPNSTKIMWEAIAKHSKHEVVIREWATDLSVNPDIILYSCTDWILEVHPIMEKHPEIKYFMTLTDYANFRRSIGYHKSNNHLFEKLSGIIACGEAFVDLCRQYTENIPLFEYESSVDVDVFKRRDKPKTFSVGSGEKFPQSQLDYFRRFLKYPYPKYTSSDFLATGRPYAEMPQFYELISVLVDPTIDSRPGGMMFLEAGAVGRPSVALKQGILAKWFPDQYLAKDDAGIIDILHRLHDDEDYYQRASDEWWRIAQSRDYRVAAKEFDAAFDSVSKR